MAQSQQDHKKRLYFIALIPEEELCQTITEIKKQMARDFNSKNALKSPPHITLYPPFHFRKEMENALKESLDHFAQSQFSFAVHVNGFNAFPPRVLYIQVEPNEKLQILHQDLLQWLKSKFALPTQKEEEREYRPHMTIASRDLSKDQFRKAWSEFKDREIKFHFGVESVFLLAHNGKDWDILHESFLGSHQF